MNIVFQLSSKIAHHHHDFFPCKMTSTEEQDTIKDYYRMKALIQKHTMEKQERQKEVSCKNIH